MNRKKALVQLETLKVEAEHMIKLNNNAVDSIQDKQALELAIKCLKDRRYTKEYIAYIVAVACTITSIITCIITVFICN